MRAITQEEMNNITDEANEELVNSSDDEWGEYRRILISLGAVRTFELLEIKGYKIIKISKTLN